jgi:8-oxo-dGTP pyrophosphatase MutT (NUDIX family)
MSAMEKLFEAIDRNRHTIPWSERFGAYSATIEGRQISVCSTELSALNQLDANTERVSRVYQAALDGWAKRLTSALEPETRTDDDPQDQSATDTAARLATVASLATRWTPTEQITQDMLSQWPVWEYVPVGAPSAISTMVPPFPDLLDRHYAMVEARPLYLPGMNFKGEIANSDMMPLHFQRMNDWQIDPTPGVGEGWMGFTLSPKSGMDEVDCNLASAIWRPAIFAELDNEPDSEREPTDSAKCSACADSGIVAGRNEYETEPCPECQTIRQPPLRKLWVACIIHDDQGRLLLAQRINPDKIDQGKLGPPGGHVHAGETLTQAAMRECFEETGCILEHTQILGMYQGDLRGLVIFVHGTIRSAPSNTGAMGAWKWYRHKELTQTRAPAVQEGILHYLQDDYTTID